MSLSLLSASDPKNSESQEGAIAFKIDGSRFEGIIMKTIFLLNYLYSWATLFFVDWLIDWLINWLIDWLID